MNAVACNVLETSLLSEPVSHCSFRAFARADDDAQPDGNAWRVQRSATDTATSCQFSLPLKMSLHPITAR